MLREAARQHIYQDCSLLFWDQSRVDPEIAIPECFVKHDEAFASLVALQELIRVDYGGGSFSGFTAASEIVRRTRQIRNSVSTWLPSQNGILVSSRAQRPTPC